MHKQEFLNALRIKFSDLPKQEVEERINFYSEMIDDQIEEGCTEQEAVSKIGSEDDISAQIVSDIPLTKTVKERILPKKHLKAWEIVLLALGSPIWISLAIAAVAIIFSLYITLWAVITSVWTVFISFTVCAIGGLIASAVFTVTGSKLTGLAMLSVVFAFIGLSIFLLFGCRAATKGALLITKKCFVKKEKAK